MTNNVNSVLQAMCDSFIDESQKLKENLQSNLTRIKELDAFLDSIHTEKESSDHLFSPRKNDFEDKITSSEKERNNIEIENLNLNKEVEKLEKRICNLREIISVDQVDGLTFLGMQERERKRIARDLHDSPLQNLTHLIHMLELSSLFIDQDPTRAKLEIAEISIKIKSIIDDIRNIVYDLRPMEFDDLGFRSAMKNMVSKLQKETNIFIDLNMEEDILINNDLIFSNVYRIIKECVVNSIKHSEAKKIKISVFMDKGICHTEIKDDGKGFDGLSAKEKTRHFGLQILEERIQLLKGILNIQSSTAEVSGTTINIMIPVNSYSDSVID